MTAEVILFPDVEDLLITYLTAEFAARSEAVPVGTGVPNPRPTEFVRLFVTGGTRLNLVVDKPSVTVEAWAELESRAIRLAGLCRGLIGAIDTITGVQFYHRPDDEFSRPQNLPDPESDQARYTATYGLSYRGAAE